MSVGLGSISKSIIPRPDEKKLYIREQHLFIDSIDRDPGSEDANSFRVPLNGTGSTFANIVLTDHERVIGLELLNACVPANSFINSSTSKEYSYLVLDIEELRSNNVNHGTHNAIDDAFAILTPTYDNSPFVHCRARRSKMLFKEPMNLRSLTFHLRRPTGTLAPTGTDTTPWTPDSPSTWIGNPEVQVFYELKVYTVAYDMVDASKPETQLYNKLVSKPL